MDNAKNPKLPISFECEKCQYKCCSKKDFAKHLDTRKHTMDKTNNTTIQKTNKTFDCKNCGNSYKYQSGLCKHVKNCQSKPQVQPQSSTDVATLTNLVMELMKNNNELHQELHKQSNDFQNQILELYKNGSKTVTNNTVTNTNTNNNQKFNINVFLNEQCKDAMNLSDFIKNIEVSREDLENNAQLGFVGGISKIFLDNLRQLSINERPIHCTDLKRETMYIKDDDKWTKETGPGKLNTVIQTITQKSTRTLLDWKKENPDYNDNDSEFSTRCIVIQRNSMAGCDRDTYYPKVIHAIAREVVVNK
jgi:hypothetical protein